MLRSGGSAIVPKEVSNSKASSKGVQAHNSHRPQTGLGVVG